jgi:hypothetical protein
VGVEYGQLVPGGRDASRAGPGWAAPIENALADVLAWAVEYRATLALVLGGALVLTVLLRRFVRG